MYNGIIFRDMQQKAFLSIAAQEGLICENGMTDGEFNRWTNYHPTYEFAKSILEQFCVAGTVYMKPQLVGLFDGELIEKGIIKPYKMDYKNRLGAMVFDTDMIQVMLAEKRYDICYYSAEQIRKEFNLLKDQARELSSIMHEDPDIEKKDTQRILRISQFDKKEMDIIERFHHLNLKFISNPVFQICEEYESIANIAYQNDLLSTVSTGKCDFYNADQSIQESSDAIMVSRYTSDKLRRIYTAGTLKDCVKLTQTDEAKAYREKIDEFINSLARSDFENMEIVDKEIEKALSAMRSKNSNITLGKIVASAGAATALAATQTDNPIKGAVATMLGTIITVTGVPIAFYDPTKKYMWASFGIYS